MSKYYTKPPTVVNGDIAFADDVNDINDESNTAFILVEADIVALEPTVEQWANLAEQWAQEAVDTEVEPGLYSAFHHATKASESASAASTSASNAATSASNALASENAAATSESNASTSASNAATSASNALASENAAATSESNAATSASDAATSESNAAASESNVVTLYDSFDDRYLGAKASEPTLDNDGNALLEGALYWNTSTSKLYIYTGSSWVLTTTDASNFVEKTSATGSALIPAGTTAQRDVSPTIGATRFNTDEGVNETWNGTEWIAGGGGGGGLTWSVVSANTTAEDGNGYVFDNSSAAHTLTLPASPDVGTTIGYKDLDGSFSIYNLTIDGGAENIQGLAEDLVVETDNAFGTLVYSGAAQGWILTSVNPSLPIQSKPLFHVQDQKPSGTNGGASVVGDNDRDLNTVLTNEISGASLGSNLITLPAGEYYIEAASISWSGDESTYVRHTIRDSLDTILLSGQSMTASRNVVSSPTISGKVTFSTSTNIKVVTYVSFALSAKGLGAAVSDGNPEVYTDLRIWKLDSDVKTTITRQPINQPITGAYTTGGIFGGELEYKTTTTVDVKPFSCYDDALSVALVKDSVTTVDLGTPTINTVYNVFLVKYDNGTYGAESDTDVNGANLPVSVVAKRYRGWVKTDSSGNIIKFNMVGNSIAFYDPFDLTVGQSTTNSYVEMSLASIIPTTRCKGITLSLTVTTTSYPFISLDGVSEYTGVGYAGSIGDGPILLANIPSQSSVWLDIERTQTVTLVISKVEIMA